MPYMKTKEGAEIFFKDWGKGQPIVFSHGWPLSSDAWDNQMLFCLQNGYRVIAHDRRGHGRSAQTWENNTMDQFADDLAQLIEHLDLRDIILVGHSTGGGEITRYMAKYNAKENERHGTKRVAKAVLACAVPPLMLKTPKNTIGLPLQVFDDMRKAMAENRAQFFRDLTLPFYNYNYKDAKISQGIQDSFWMQGMMGSLKAEYDCVREFSEVDFTEDLKKIDVPTLIIHSDEDQIVPIGASAMLSSKLVKNAEFKMYHGAPHGLPQTHSDKFNADLLSFIRQKTATPQKEAEAVH